MALLDRVRVEWSGAPVVGPGVSTFYFTAGGAGMVAATRLLFGSLAAWFPTAIRWNVSPNGDVIEDSTGDIAGSWSDTPGSVVSGNYAGNYLEGVGGRISWLTASRTRNRVVRGTTFCVPIGVQAFGPDGLLTGAWTGDAMTAANVLVNNSANELRVWTRPQPGQSNGTSHIVTSAVAPLTPSWLTSRKT